MTLLSEDYLRQRREGTSFSEDAAPQTESTFGSDLQYALDVVKSGRKLIAALAIGAVLAAFGYIWTTDRLYTSTAAIMIDPRKREIVKQEILPSGMGSSSLGADTFMLDSQVEMMGSQGLLRQLIERLNLEQDDELAGLGGNASLQKLKDLVKLVINGTLQEISPRDRVLKSLERELHIARQGNTYVIEVQMTSKDPAKAAIIANALTELYIEQNVANARDRIKEVEAILSGRLEELRRSAVAAQDAVELYRTKNGLIATDNIPIVEQQLRDLNRQLTVAAANTSRADARWQEIRRIESAPFEVALASGAGQSSLLASLQDRYAASLAQLSTLSTTLKGRHPDLAIARTVAATLKGEIELELARLVQRAKLDYEIAVTNEAGIRERLAQSKALTAETSAAAVTLKELERQAEAASSIYREFLNRAKDAQEQIALPADSVRIVSRAVPPTRPSWPVPPLILGFSLFLGLFVGTIATAVRHVTRGSRIERHGKPTATSA